MPGRMRTGSGYGNRNSGRSGGYGGERSGERSSGGPGGGSRFGGRPTSREGMESKTRFFRKKVCRLCAERVSGVDYKDIERLVKFLTEKGKILPQRITGNCSRHQRLLGRAVKRARHTSLIAFQMS